MKSGDCDAGMIEMNQYNFNMKISNGVIRKKTSNPNGTFNEKLKSIKREARTPISEHLKPSNTKRNERERKRVKTINDYFAKLQKFLPNSANLDRNANKKLSKVETLKAAIDYIEYLQLAENLNKSNNYKSTSFTSLSSPSTSCTSSCHSTPVSPHNTYTPQYSTPNKSHDYQHQPIDAYSRFNDLHIQQIPNRVSTMHNQGFLVNQQHSTSSSLLSMHTDSVYYGNRAPTSAIKNETTYHKQVSMYEKAYSAPNQVENEHNPNYPRPNYNQYNDLSENLLLDFM